MYKTELHVHTSPVSRCAHIDARTAAKHFCDEGYDTIVITNHMSPALFSKNLPCDADDWRAVADYFLSDYRKAKAAVGDKMQVLLGMELRINKNGNDYLVYGIDEQFVYDMGNVMNMKLKDIVGMIHDAGGIILQAHPFRDNMTVTNPSLLDGIEVVNFTAGHNSRNDIAMIWAKKHGMLGICGQDYHNTDYIIGAGILTDELITDVKQLVDILKRRDFQMTDGEGILTY